MSPSTNHAPEASSWLQPLSEQEGLTRYVQTLRDRIWIVVAMVAITTGVAVLYVSTATKMYEATADVQVIPAPQGESQFANLPLLRSSSDPTRDVETAAQQFTNIDVAERVVKKLDLSVDPMTLLDDVTAEPVAQSNILAITATASDPQLAQDLANTFAEQAIVEQTETLHDYIEQILPGLEAQIEGGELPLLEQEVSQLRVLLEQPVPTLQVQTEATLPTSPVSPRTTISIAAGIFAGLVLGIAIAFAIQILDPRLRREEQLRRLYNLPILGRIPRELGRSEPSPLNPLALSPAATEAYRTLRGTLAVSRRRSGQDSTAILVTGSSPSEGKTTTAINLATSLAASGNSVILIEADLRRPSISKTLNVRAERGVVSVLIESVALSDALLTTEEFGPNLGLLLADYEGGWITELFALPSAAQLIHDARQIANYVIVDSPPLTDVIDALPLAQYVDDVLVVVRLGQTRLPKLAQLGELLVENDIKPVGFAVVGTPRPSRSDYHYYRESREENGLGSTAERKLASRSASTP